MKRFSVVTVLSIFLVIAFGAAMGYAENGNVRITEMAVTTKIVRGNPIDSVHRISSASVKQLFCFTRTTAEEDGETTIKHVWYRDNQKVAEYELPIKGKRWRTYSRKAIEKGWSGEWRVEALDAEGKLLKAVTFRMN